MMSFCKLQVQAAQPAVQIPPRGLRLDGFGLPRRQREKVVVVMGATGTGKSRLSIDLATLFQPAEVVNSDKMQVYEGLDVITNKITKEEQRGVHHHLLGTLENPDADFTASNFCDAARDAVTGILAHRRLPIIVGGSNSFVERLIDGDEDDGGIDGLRSRYECCFLWVDVEMPDLHRSVAARVDVMLRHGMVEEARELYDAGNSCYARGLRRAIGVPEFDAYFRGEGKLEEAVREVKDNTCRLACRQLKKICRLKEHKGWWLHRLDATKVCRARGPAEVELAWKRHVAGPGSAFVRQFLCDELVPECLVAGLRVPAQLAAAGFH